ncbi:hypothetical protein ACFSBZ_07495 [Amnibacterium flavum]|uniref:Uncharacterized protein n=1 Tax=Amnibacterium flavum TaxID=2173173 RepID=A0A2V1HMT4_9MICO|nr:hypothetical protein [Amnibacterium flavum]PVZ93731.1 hypothetical protein DDQ50_08005 [Amnibacterium flavum]
MITVWVDRDSVAMGDDVESHEVAWEFEDHACAGDVLDRVLSSHYLASVSGDVSWSLNLGRFDVMPREDYTSIRAVETRVAAVVHVPLHGSSDVITLSSRLLFQPLVRMPQWAVSEGVYAVDFTYSSEGALLSESRFRSWLRNDEPRRRAIASP